LKAIENLNQSVSDLTHIITVSCTGMYAPGLDIEIISTLGLNTTIQRTAINFMGCYGAFNGLKMADTICRANPEAKVLLVCVELCTLHFQKRSEDDFLLSNALFADGAAAVLVESNSAKNGQKSLALKSFFCDLYFEGKQDMAWNVADFGFEMTLTSYIPKLVKTGIKSLIDRLLSTAEMQFQDISLYAMHPGGKAILEAIESSLEMKKEDNRYAYEVLRDYGNMSSCTVLFVLDKILKDAESQIGSNVLSCAFGPGLTLESMVLTVHGEQF
jgi:alpha-pyrone synthase